MNKNYVKLLKYMECELILGISTIIGINFSYAYAEDILKILILAVSFITLILFVYCAFKTTPIFKELLKGD